MTERELFDREVQRIATFCKNPPPRGEDMVGYLSAHLCILLYGYFENSVERIVYSDCPNMPDKKVKSHGNFKPKELKKYVARRSPQCRRELSTIFINDVDMGEMLTSLVDSRNRIAHRDRIAHNGNGYLSVSQLENYAEKIYALEDLITDIVKKHPLH